MAAIKHYIETVAGVTRHMVLRLAHQDGTPATAADYAIYGAARQGDRIHPFAVAPMDPSSVRLSIPPLESSNYTYDLFAKHTATGIEHALLCGSIRVADRVASMPPADQGGEHIEAAISSDLTDITVTVQIVPVITAATWEAIEASIATADSLLETASNLLPAARQEIATVTDTAKQDITAHTSSETAAAKKDISRTAGQAAAETAGLIAATGETASTAVRQEAARATSSALEAISTAEATAINQATNTGISAIGQSITAGTTAIETAVTTGTGTISDKVTASLQLIDGYVGTTTDDLARYSKAGQWTGVQTLNAPLIANGGIIAQGADLIKTIYTAALMDALYCDTAAGWTDKYAGATSGSGYNSIHYGTESSTSYLGKTAAGTLSRTDMTHQMVCKHLAIYGNDCMAGITAVVNIDKDAFWSAGNQLTGYCFGQAMHVHADVPFETMIDPAYTPNVGGTPTVMFSAAPNEQVRVDIFYSTIHRQVIVPKISNVSQRVYRQLYVIIWTPTRFMVHLLPAYPATDWRCIARIDGKNMSSLYRTNIIGWQGTNAFRIGISLSAHSLNTYAAAGYGDWMQPLIHITA